MADKPKKTETNKLTKSLDTIPYKKPRVLEIEIRALEAMLKNAEPPADTPKTDKNISEITRKRKPKINTKKNDEETT